MRKALVVFANSENPSLRWFLKDGFQHCFCVVSIEGLWIEINPQGSSLDLRFVTNDDGSIDLAEFYREQGLTVVETQQQKGAPFAGIMVHSCVGLLKAVLGIRAWAVTPYQLYKHLLFTDLEGA